MLRRLENLTCKKLSLCFLQRFFFKEKRTIRTKEEGILNFVPYSARFLAI